MIYSGVDLIRTSGQHADQLRKLNGPEAVSSTAAIDPTSSTSQDPSQESAQNALLRFARFIKGETSKKKRPGPAARKPTPSSRLPGGYRRQIEMFAGDSETPVPTLDIYV